MANVMSDQLWNKLIEVMDLPKHTRRLTLRLGLNELVVAEAEFFPELSPGSSGPEYLVETMKEYRLVEKDNAKPGEDQSGN
jgi:hypothetical protein